MNEQERIQKLIDQCLALRHNIHVIYHASDNSNVKFYLRNALDYYEGLAREIVAAQEAAEQES